MILQNPLFLRNIHINIKMYYTLIFPFNKTMCEQYKACPIYINTCKKLKKLIIRPMMNNQN